MKHKEGFIEARRYAEEQFLAVLREVDAGAKAADLCRKSGMSDEYPNENWFLSLRDAREIIESWRTDYSDGRPRSARLDLSPSKRVEPTRKTLIAIDLCRGARSWPMKPGEIMLSTRMPVILSSEV